MLHMLKWVLSSPNTQLNPIAQLHHRLCEQAIHSEKWSNYFDWFGKGARERR